MQLQPLGDMMPELRQGPDCSTVLEQPLRNVSEALSSSAESRSMSAYSNPYLFNPGPQQRDTGNQGCRWLQSGRTRCSFGLGFGNAPLKISSIDAHLDLESAMIAIALTDSVRNYPIFVTIPVYSPTQHHDLSNTVRRQGVQYTTRP
mmetsp:Transcript_19916/g.31173  ORF Transcript_19916/g.31173 Transcript_19916/m.31173 type:complete len:147 (+) Transcript_19916:1099-1539(+)